MKASMSSSVSVSPVRGIEESDRLEEDRALKHINIYLPKHTHKQTHKQTQSLFSLEMLCGHINIIQTSPLIHKKGTYILAYV